MPQRLFVFLQLEFPWALGPPAGRYLMRGEPDADAEHVVVFDSLDATRAGARSGAPPGGPLGWILRRMGLTARAKPATPDPAPVTTSRVTVIDPVSLSAEHQARAWLDELDVRHYVQDGVAVVNRVIHLHRLASADPYVHEIAANQALVIRAGWGEGEQVADGRWLHARELVAASAAPGRTDGGGRRRAGSRQRTAALRPQERLAALLGARTQSLLCEELVLRARLDMDHGRLELAAVGVASALRVAVGELAGEARQDLALRLAELEQLRDGAETQADAALPSASHEIDEELVAHALERLEAALRARTAPGFSLR